MLQCDGRLISGTISAMTPITQDEVEVELRRGLGICKHERTTEGRRGIPRSYV